MLAAERRNEILALLKEEGRVIVADLSKKYDVTEETIRRDLEKLENDGFAERTYGGAVVKGNEKDEIPFLVRKRENVDAKMRLATALSDTIHDGDRIMLDASTTALFVAKQIKDKKYPASIESYAGEMLLVGISYDTSSKEHQCVIEKYEKV